MLVYPGDAALRFESDGSIDSYAGFEICQPCLNPSFPHESTVEGSEGRVCMSTKAAAENVNNAHCASWCCSGAGRKSAAFGFLSAPAAAETQRPAARQWVGSGAALRAALRRPGAARGVAICAALLFALLSVFGFKGAREITSTTPLAARGPLRGTHGDEDASLYDNVS